MTDGTPDPFTFSTRLMLTYILAGLAFAAAGKSIYILAVAFIAWVVFVARLFLRFRARAAWSLAGAPLALYWAVLLYLQHASADGVIV